MPRAGARRRRGVAVAHGLAARGGRAANSWDGVVWPDRPPTHKEAADSGASEKQALSMPWFPTHAIECDGRPCRPGEGNLKGYRFWGQPYIHREEFVQAQSRRPPHQPEPTICGLEASHHSSPAVKHPGMHRPLACPHT